MIRRLLGMAAVVAVATLLTTGCEQAGVGATLRIDVDPYDAFVSVTREIDGVLIHQGIGSVTLRSLLPGTYLVVTGEGDDMTVERVTVGVHERGDIIVSISAKGNGNGGGGSGGNGGSGGGGGSGGKGSDYADLVLLYRSEHGVPITIGPWQGEHGIAYCVQPIAAEPVPNPYYLLDGALPEFLPPTVNPVDGRTVTLVPLFAHYPEFLPTESTSHRDATDALVTPSHSVEDGGEPCDPLVIQLSGGGTFSYGAYTTEVELERLNLARAPEHVLRQHMREVESLVAATDPQEFTLDPAGRPVFAGAAVDAMPKLQGIREALLEMGTLPGVNGRYPFPFTLVSDSYAHWNTWELSAFALGGAASKFGTINVDIVAYHDRIMGIASDMGNTALWPKLTHYSPELGEAFVDYSGFTYDRAETFPGCVVYLDPANWTAGFTAQRLLDVVPFSELTPKQDNLAGYAQMAEDARAVIYFVHLYESVIAHADPVGLDSWDFCQTLAADLNAY